MRDSHISEDYEEFALFRALRDWALAEGKDAYHANCFGGPCKRVTKRIEDPEFMSISVDASTKHEGFCIEVTYMTKDREGKPYEINNPTTMVVEDGRVIRTHGDFNRAREWVKENILPKKDRIYIAKYEDYEVEPHADEVFTNLNKALEVFTVRTYSPAGGILTEYEVLEDGTTKKLKVIRTVHATDPFLS